MKARWTLLAAGLAVAAAVACKDKPKPDSPRPEPAASVASSTVLATTASAANATGSNGAWSSGDAEHGKALVAKFECSRCHQGTGLAAPRLEKDCVGCHQQILDGRFPGPAATVAKWKPVVAPVEDAPSLAALGKRGHPEAVAAFLLKPRDLRPNLVPTMPRLALGADEARDIATYLTRDAAATAEETLANTDAAHGRALMEDKGCGTCHVMGGVAALPTQPSLAGTRDQRRAVTLAPDLRWARDRWLAAPLVEWLLDPNAFKPGTRMPTHNLARSEARDIAAYLLRTPLTAYVPKAVPARLPVLTRRVTYDEVVEHVIGKTCRHCHGEADIAMGDGGPGNTGGFGFTPRGLNLATYESTGAGILDAKGERHSVFDKTPDGVPRLVAALIARQKEEAGQIDPEVRGMPIGLPALSAEDVQVVESWVAQGRPR